MKRFGGKKKQQTDAPQDAAPASGPTARSGSGRRWLGAAAMVAVVFVLAALIGDVVRQHQEKQLTPPAAAGGPSSFAIPVTGKTPVTLTVYEDMRDPASVAFEQTYGATLAQLVASGTANVQYREVAGVDAAKGGTGSLNAGNALACAQDAKLFSAYRTVLLQNQPAGDTDAFADKSQLIALAKQVKKLDTDVFRSCVDKGAHNVWVKDSTKDFDAAGLGSVPVLAIKVIYADNPTTILDSTLKLTPKKLFSMVIAEAKTAPTATPSATPSS